MQLLIQIQSIELSFYLNKYCRKSWIGVKTTVHTLNNILYSFEKYLFYMIQNLRLN